MFSVHNQMPLSRAKKIAVKQISLRIYWLVAIKGVEIIVELGTLIIAKYITSLMVKNWNDC